MSADDASVEPEPRDVGDPLRTTAYRAIERLGEGATSEVWEAEHRTLGYRVVVKLLHAYLFVRTDLKHRMELEAHACLRMSHENLVRVMEFGETKEGRTFLVMERLFGRSLEKELLVRCFLPVNESLAVIEGTLAGLAAAHSMGLVHRDIKPANLFLCSLPNGQRRVKVLDFGYAKIIDLANEAWASGPHGGLPSATSAPRPSVPRVTTTAEGMMVGTPHYLSPEQADAQRDMDARADIYSTGCVLYELLTGSPPFFHRKTVADVARAHLAEVPNVPSAMALQPIPPAVDKLVMKALAKRREDRFPNAAAFRNELQKVHFNSSQ